MLHYFLAFHVLFAFLLSAPAPDRPATVFLTVPTKKSLENGTATFLCLAQQFSPKHYSFKWFQNDKVVTNAISTYDTSEKNASVTLYSATSIFQISADTWTNPETKVKCEFEHKTGNQVIEAQYTGMFSLEDCECFFIHNVYLSLNLLHV